MQPAPTRAYRSLEIDDSPNASVSRNRTAHWIAYSPSPAISVVGAYTPTNATIVDCKLAEDGFTAKYFWPAGASPISYLRDCNAGQGYGYGTGFYRTFSPSSYFGWGVTCSLKSACSTSSPAGAVLWVKGIRLTVQENDPPLILLSSRTLWDQTGHWIRGGGWPVGFTGTDPSGVCGTDLLINGKPTSIDSTRDIYPNYASFTQCWPADAASGALDTTGYPNGPLTIAYSARNAAGVTSSPDEALLLDNTPVTLALSTPNDADPNVWVNHAVQVDAVASGGPSGIGGTSCSTNSGRSYTYPSSGIELNGTGVWKVACSSWNNAFDVTGQPGYSPVESLAVRIDETPPTVAFEPTNPADPQAIVARTTDAQSGVATGQIEIRPASGGSWQSLATQVDGAQLAARLDDATLAPGTWEIQAASCDRAGNCATTQQKLTLPVRVASVSSVGFEKAGDHSKSRAPCEGRFTIGERNHRDCRRPRAILSNKGLVAFGKSGYLHGLLTTVEGAPIAHASVRILSAPDNGLAQYGQVAFATTNGHGVWTATLPPGPSRLVAALYAGSPTIQPSEAWARVIVPASVRVLRVWPSHIPWGGQVHIRAQVAGGYLPPGGALVRLRLGYGTARTTYGVREHVGGNGVFEVTNTFGPGPAGLVLHYWLQECTLPESDYPFAPACGPRTVITVGG